MYPLFALQCGDIYLLGIQILAAVILITWTGVVSYIFLKIIDLTVGLRISPLAERLGSDLVEHDISNTNLKYDKVKQEITILSYPDEENLGDLGDHGHNEALPVLQDHVNEITRQDEPTGITEIDIDIDSYKTKQYRGQVTTFDVDGSTI